MIKRFFTEDEKSRIIFKNVVISGIFKIISMAVNLVSVPLLLGYLSETKYGVWLTISSIMTWFVMFDFGIGNGLRNKIAEAGATKKTEEIKTYISTAYYYTTFIFATIWVIFLGIFFFVNWSSAFNAEESFREEIGRTIFISVTILCLQYMLRLITTVLLAFHKPGLADALISLGQILILPFLILLPQFKQNSLSLVAWVYALTPLLVMCVASFYFYRGKFAEIRPSIRFVDKKYLKSVMGLGIQFFIIQAAALVMFATDNILITHLFSPDAVTTFNIAFRYFSLVHIAFTIILNPYWSMTTRAYAEGDIHWLQKSVRRITLIWLGLSAISICQLVFSDNVYRFWVGSSVIIPFELSATFCLYFITMTYANIYATLLNGLGKINLQLIFAVIGMIINIPLSIFLVKNLELGPKGVIIATIFSIVVGALVSHLQFHRLIRTKKSEIYA